MVYQTNKNFEVVIVEDGSVNKCDKIYRKYVEALNISYYYKENTGAGLSRNFGANKAKGNYFVFLDSDCILTNNYFEIIDKELKTNYVDCFGGPDKSHPSFNNFQKAINYSMTSILTTGGIRGKSEKVQKFYPRSYNMGISKKAFFYCNGFSEMVVSEDIDFSTRLINSGFKTRLIKPAFVYHKRRTDIKKFFNQVEMFGVGRVILHYLNPNSLKVFHLFPTAFLLSNVVFILLSLFYSPLFLLPSIVYGTLCFIDSYIRNNSFSIGLLSVITSFTQLFAYGFGFIKGVYERFLRGKVFFRHKYKVYNN